MFEKKSSLAVIKLNPLAALVGGATLLMITCTQSYVLLAANLNDFKKLAKKFVPEDLASQIAEMAAAPVRHHSQDYENSPQHGKYQEEEGDVIKEEIAEPDMYENQDDQIETLPRRREVTRLNFEDLVQKVKERIEEDMIKKKVLYTTTPGKSFKYRGPASRFSVAGGKPDNGNSNQHAITKPSDDDKYHGYRQIKRPHIARLKERLGDTIANAKLVKNIHVNTKEDDDNVYADNQQSYADKTPEPSKPHDDYDYEDEDPNATGQHKNNPSPNEETGDLPYSKVNMLKNDSYEDYVTPEKEKNIYSSRESVKNDNKFVNTKRNSRTTRMAVIPVVNSKGNNKDDYKSDGVNYYDNGEELKAKTENLSYDEHVNNNAEQNSKQINSDTTPLRNNNAKGTNIPTRDYYKMSSPNYVIKIPVVAEKYDFNEPIPEKDREPEDLKPIPAHPSVINGKVKLN